MSMTHAQAVEMSENVNALSSTNCEARPIRIGTDAYWVRVLIYKAPFDWELIAVEEYIPKQELERAPVA